MTLTKLSPAHHSVAAPPISGGGGSFCCHVYTVVRRLTYLAARIKVGVKTIVIDIAAADLLSLEVSSDRSVMVKARKWVIRSHFSGVPKREDLEIVEEELPPLKDGGQAV